MFNSRTIRPALFLGMALAALVSASVPARAEDEVQVSASDLDLRTFSGQAELRQRVVKAARKVCAPAELRGSAYYDYYNDCVKKTAAKAEAQVQSLIASSRANTFYVAALLLTK